jgi:hypothetical protein
MLQNLAALVGNYSAVGVRFFVLAGTIRDTMSWTTSKPSSRCR